MSKTKISWCDEVWNPVVGCSADCGYCYARELHDRRHKAWLDGWTTAPRQYRVSFGSIQLFPERLDIPLRRKKPTVFFVNSVSDLFDPGVSEDFIIKCYETMIKAKQHTFIVLTKQAERMADFFSPATCFREPNLHNVWHGVTIENQQTADERIPHLLRVPGKRFLSIEPMLGPVDLTKAGAIEWDSVGCTTPGGGEHFSRGLIDAVLLGGESGKNARPMEEAWAKSVRDQCAAANVPYFFKQWGEYAPCKALDSGQNMMFRVGKKAAGRLLDGRLHDSLPWNKLSTEGASDAQPV